MSCWLEDCSSSFWLDDWDRLGLVLTLLVRVRGLGDWREVCLGDWREACLGDWREVCLGDWMEVAWLEDLSEAWRMASLKDWREVAWLGTSSTCGGLATTLGLCGETWEGLGLMARGSSQPLMESPAAPGWPGPDPGALAGSGEDWTLALAGSRTG